MDIALLLPYLFFVTCLTIFTRRLNWAAAAVVVVVVVVLHNSAHLDL